MADSKNAIEGPLFDYQLERDATMYSENPLIFNDHSLYVCVSWIETVYLERNVIVRANKPIHECDDFPTPTLSPSQYE
jgi:hypothetical protein